MTGALSIPLAVVALYVDTSLQRVLWAAFAVTAFAISAFRVWLAENRRAETAETELATRARPWVIIDGYEWETFQDDTTGEEYDGETLHLVNRGGVTAINVEIPPLRLSRGSATVFRQPPSLPPDGETTIQIHGLRACLGALRDQLVKQSPKVRSVSVPLTIRYRDLAQGSWETIHAVTFGGSFVVFKVIQAGEVHDWTESPDAAI